MSEHSNMSQASQMQREAKLWYLKLNNSHAITEVKNLINQARQQKDFDNVL